MKSRRPRLPFARQWLLAGAASLCLALSIGCASPSPPHPPSLHLSEVPTDLTAQRVGDDVHLHWTTPTETTDGLPLKGALTAEICRIVARATATANTAGAFCVPVKRLAVQPGSSDTKDSLSGVLIFDPATLLTYHVQILNASGRSAGPSPGAFAASGAAPPPVEQLRATTVRSGAMLEWRRQDTSAVVELDRQPGVPPPFPAAPSALKPTPKPVSRFKPKPSTASKPLPSAPAELKLQTPSAANDPGGVIDHTAQKDQTYRYIAQRVRTVTLDGHSLELRSLPSAAVTMQMRDTFPPQRPTGLAAVLAPAEHAIDLSWEPDTDEDLAGYYVYRQEVTSTEVPKGIPLRLNSSPLVGPAYRDPTALPGHRYAYRITATDTSGNESTPSADVQETLPRE